MKYLNYLLIGIFALAVLYSLTGIGYFKYLYYKVDNPKEDFLIIESENNDVTIVNFYAYQCGFCKKIHTSINEAAALENDVSQILRPIQILQDEDALKSGIKFIPEKIVLAAGMQGKFNEFHEAFMELPIESLSEDFIIETANLYNVDYEQLLKDAQGEHVQNILNDNMTTMMDMGIRTIPSFIVDQNIYIVQESLPTLSNFLAILNKEKK